MLPYGAYLGDFNDIMYEHENLVVGLILVC